MGLTRLFGRDVSGQRQKGDFGRSGPRYARCSIGYFSSCRLPFAINQMKGAASVAGRGLA